ncbi:hypothetical protein N7457_008248 [Penicillium paradoxum]|uniref:uncharacterized protein n=1 Tax=Penicillium paradoxum TaxID=176176 RepID=UPI0025494021|nr:uncharacterized protein N7457_008248 [Penicillium paradoxum]KAJ5773352.1 hypothetical protein N7457_008248 [Penicillium paradoxum]
MAQKRSKRSTESSLDFLNNINTPFVNAQDLKRRRTIHGDIYDIPVSPTNQSPKVAQTEPRNTSRLDLRNRPAPGLAPRDSSLIDSDNAEGQGSSNGESEPEDSESGPDGSEPILYQNKLDGNDEEKGNEALEDLPSEAEEDPFPEPVDLFPADEAQVEESRDESDRRSEDEYSEYEDQVGSHGSNDSRDAHYDQFGDEGIDDIEESGDNDSLVGVQNHSTYTQKTVRPKVPEVQICATSQSNHSRISRGSADSQELQNYPSGLHEILETPTIQSPYPDQSHQSARSDIFSWLTEATKESGFKETWDAIRVTRKTLRTHADSSMKERFGHIIKLIQRLRDHLETIVDDPASASSSKHQCNLLANNIFKEVQWILYTEAPEDDDEGAHLVNQLEAHIVPRLIDLIIRGFKTYKTINDRGVRHFRIILDLLWGCCDKIFSLSRMPYDISLSVRAYSKKIVQHVKVIKDALNDGRLRETATRIPRRPQTYKHFVLDELDGHISCGRWTFAERKALRDGLHLYEGEDRFIDIKCDNIIGPQLSERIVQDVQNQTIKLNLDPA